MLPASSLSEDEDSADDSAEDDSADDESVTDDSADEDSADDDSDFFFPHPVKANVPTSAITRRTERILFLLFLPIIPFSFEKFLLILLYITIGLNVTFSYPFYHFNDMKIKKTVLFAR